MVLDATRMTILDLAKRKDPNGQLSKIAEMLMQTNDILLDMPFIEGNTEDGHQVTVRTGLPTGTHRKYNGGITVEKSTTKQTKFGCEMLEGLSQIDVDIAKRSGDVNGARWSELMAHTMGMNQTMASDVFYADPSTNEEKLMSLSKMFGTYSTTSTDSGSHILKDSNGAGSVNTSLWLIGWGPETAFGITPKGSASGLSLKDNGEVPALDANSKKFFVYEHHLKWDMGIAVKNWKAIVRIQVKAADLKKDASAGADLIDLAISAQEMIRSVAPMCKPMWYGNSTITTFLLKQAMNKTGNTLRFADVTEASGVTKSLLHLGLYPVRFCDALTNTEAQIS